MQASLFKKGISNFFLIRQSFYATVINRALPSLIYQGFLEIMVTEPAIQTIQENTTQVQAVVGPYLRLELSDSSCILFSYFRVEFKGGFSW